MSVPRRKTLAVRASGSMPVKLVSDIRALIEAARGHVAQVVNAGMVSLYWNIGRRINQELLGGKRAQYGGRIVSAAGRQLAAEYGDGFSEKSLRHMIRFAEAFPDEKIVSALRRQLSWTHFKRLIYIEDSFSLKVAVATFRLILCAGGAREEIELLQLGKSGIRVAEYMTELPPRRVLEKKLHQAIAAARARLADGGPEKELYYD